MVPFMSQITRWPVELFCQRMSALQSPLKSLFAQGTTLTKLNLPMRVAHEACWLSGNIRSHARRSCYRRDRQSSYCNRPSARWSEFGAAPIGHYGFPLGEVI